MEKKSVFYSAPTTKYIVVRYGSVLMGSPNGYNPGGGGSYGDGDTNNNGDF